MSVTGDIRYRRNRDPASLDDLGAIRSLLTAIAEHHSIDIKKDVPPITISTGAIDPKEANYNEDRTIQYRLRQLPRELSLRPQQIWRPTPFKLNIAAPETGQDLEAGMSDVLSLTMDIHKLLYNGNVDYDELGYDENGHICRLAGRDAHHSGSAAMPHMDIRENIFKKEEGQVLSPVWKGQHFGNEWNIGLHGILGDDWICQIVIAQLSSDPLEAPAEEAAETSYLALSRKQLATSFVDQFTKEWELSRHSWSGSDEKTSLANGWGAGIKAARESSSWEDLVFQYHMRVFTTQSGTPGPRLNLKRVSGSSAAQIDIKRNLEIHEIRYSVGLKTTWELDLPVFSLVTMTDCFTGLEDLGELCDPTIWTAVNIRPSLRATGVAAFAFRIRSLLPGWAAQWSCLLNQIDRAASADLASILSPSRRREIMVDDRDLALSEFYPVVLQILRIAVDWIQESMDDLRWMVDDIERFYFSTNTNGLATFLPAEQQAHEAAIEVFKQNWDSVLSYQKRLGSVLLARISRTRGEVENRSEEMFNATFFSEAKKSSRLNNYLFVFATITILYLPLGFVVALFTLGLFDWDNPGQTKSFMVTMASVSAVTYAFSGLLVWCTRRPSRLDAATDALTAARSVTRKLWVLVEGLWSKLLQLCHRMNR